MRARDREFLKAERRQRLESMLQRFSQVRQVVPWLQPGMSHSQLRRTAARLRAGVIRPVDPRIAPAVLADVIEKAIVQDLLVRSVVREMFELSRIERALVEKNETERVRDRVAGFHRAKKSAEADDPEGSVAQRFRRLHRRRRNELGRPR